jgi:serine/threonine-protein kinase
MEKKILVPDGNIARYASSGHLVYAAGNTLFAVRFDARRLEVQGNAVPVMEGILTRAGVAPNYAVSRNGHLLYATQDPQSQLRSLVWVDRTGSEVPIPAPPRAYIYPRLSPDGSRLAISVADQEMDVWIWNFARRALTRLTLDPARDMDPVWTADGQEIVFSSDRGGGFLNPYRQNADGRGTAQRLTESPYQQFASSVTPDGSAVIFHQFTLSNWDVLKLSLDGGGEAEPVLASQFAELHADISPDGKWIAYQSTESDRAEVYVRSFPDPESAGQSQVSIDGGSRPLWARNGRELFFLDPVGRLTTVPVQLASGSFTAGNPSRVLDRAYVNADNARTYDVSSDGQRFLMVKETGAATAEPVLNLVLVQNWFEELKRLAP